MSAPDNVWARLQSVGRDDWFIDFTIQGHSGSKPPMQTIGRNPASTLCLTENMTVSNRHVSLEQSSKSDGHRVVVLHESSSNGTWINGAQYQKGSSVEIPDGAEISFPCEDTMKPEKKREYTFVFHVYEQMSSAREGDNKEPTAEWIKLQEQCDELAKEASRLAANVYSNNDNLKELSKTLVKDSSGKAVSQLENTALEMLAALKMAEDRLRQLGDNETADKVSSQSWEDSLAGLGLQPRRVN